MVVKSILGVLTSPMKTLTRIAEERPVLQATWVVVFTSWSWCFGSQFAHNHGGGKLAEFVSEYSVPHALVFGTVFQVAWYWLLFLAPVLGFVFWFVRVAVLHLSAEILGGTGRGFSLLASFGFAHAPMLLLFPAALISAGMGGGDLSSGTGAFVWYALALGIHLWTLYSVLLSIRATHRMALLDAARVVIYPILALFLAVFLLKICVALSHLSFSDLVSLAREGLER